MKTVKVLYMIAFVASILAGMTFFITCSEAESAPQEASGFTAAVAIAAIPYIAARCLDLASRRHDK